MITLERARALLPKDYELTDEELSSVLADAYLVANFAVSDFLSGRLQEDEKNNTKKNTFL